MPEFLRALIAILVLASAVFFIVPRFFPAAVMNPEDFRRRRNLWFGITTILFLANNFWVYLIGAGILIWRASTRDSNKIALLFFILFAAPTTVDRISGFGLVNFLMEIGYARLLALVILLPAFFEIRSDRKAAPLGQLLPDKFIIGYIVLLFGLALSATSVTNALRAGVVYSFIDIFLPYYVASRMLQRLEEFRDVMIAYTTAVLVLAVIGIFESGRHWLLYTPLNDSLGIVSGLGVYLARGDDEGLLRAQGSTGHAIPLGYALAMALAVFHYVRELATSPRMANLLGLVLLAGLIAPMSRGPWVGAAGLIALLVLTGPSAAKGFIRLLLLGLVGVAVLAPTDLGQRLVATLPFIGETSHTLDYRERLLRVSISIILDSPVFGSFDYLSAMEELRQGQGIIDIVNSYIGVALSSGLVGLSLFVGAFLSAAAGVVRAMRSTGNRNDEVYRLGQALLAALFGTLIIIGSTSSITVIPVIYWPLIGVCTAYAGMAANRRAAGETTAGPVSAPTRTIDSARGIPQPALATARRAQRVGNR